MSPDTTALFDRDIINAIAVLQITFYHFAFSCLFLALRGVSVLLDDRNWDGETGLITETIAVLD